jgi:hypothetical protein
MSNNEFYTIRVTKANALRYTKKYRQKHKVVCIKKELVEEIKKIPDVSIISFVETAILEKLNNN